MHSMNELDIPRGCAGCPNLCSVLGEYGDLERRKGGLTNTGLQVEEIVRRVLLETGVSGGGK